MSFTSAYINRIVHTERTIKVHSNKELIQTVEKEIDKHGWECSLNHIDVSEITDFSGVFRFVPDFNGDISDWDVSNGTKFCYMFAGSKFNGDLSKWNMSNAKTTSSMFFRSEFNRDICLWDLKNLQDASSMFYMSKFNQEIGYWELPNLCNAESMLYNKCFQQDISDWNLDECVCVSIINPHSYLQQLPVWMIEFDSKYRNELVRMKKIKWCIDEYRVLSPKELEYLDVGVHTIYLDMDNGQVLGKNNGKESIKEKYSFEIKENMDNLDYALLYRNIKKTDFEKLSCVYYYTLNRFYPNLFVSRMSPWIKKHNDNAFYDEEQLYLLDSVNWHAKKAGLPQIFRNDDKRLEYLKKV